MGPSRITARAGAIRGLRRHRHLPVRSAPARTVRSLQARARCGLRRRQKSDLPASARRDLLRHRPRSGCHRRISVRSPPDWRRICRRETSASAKSTALPWETAASTRSSAAPSCTLRPTRRTSIACWTSCGGCWRPEGVFFARLASNIGIEGIVGSAGRRSHLPDGSERFLVDEAHPAGAHSPAGRHSCSIRSRPPTFSSSGA